MKKVLSLLLVLTMVLGMFSASTVFASAASVSSSLGYDQPENSGDYAYWNGSKVVKSSSTSKDEIKWMQKALNYCIANEGLSATKLTIDGSFGPASKKATIAFQKAAGLTADGSFGPATIKKMKTILDDGNATFKKSAITTTNSGKITTQMIKAVCDKYGYTSGKYWTVQTSTNYPGYSNCAKTNYKGKNCVASTIPQGGKDSNGKKYMSYNYNNTWECCGFASFVMHEVTGKELNAKGSSATAQNGWKVYKSTSAAGSLKVGDIVRYNGHSAVVYSVDSKGNATFVECWGGSDCVIKINSGFNKSSGTRTLSYFNNSNLKYIYRYEG